MNTITLTEDKLNDIVDKAAHKAAEDTLVQLVTSENGLSKFLDLIEDIGMGKILESTKAGGSIPADEFLKELDNYIASLP